MSDQKQQQQPKCGPDCTCKQDDAISTELDMEDYQ